MAGELAGDDVNDIDPHFFRLADEARKQQFGGRSDAAKAILVERMIGGGAGGACLHLHKGQHLAAACDEVDFADGGSDALVQDGPALAAEEPGGEPFRPPAPALGLGAGPAQRPSSSARS